MDWKVAKVLFLCFVAALVVAEDEIDDEEIVSDKHVMKARVESCTGWRLNRLPDVKKFIHQDIPLFHNVEFKGKPGANPDLLLLNLDDKVMERIDLSKYDREGCNQLLKDKGFHKKASEDDTVPEEKLQGPYFPTVKDEL
jgi:hypothetical protein